MIFQEVWNWCLFEAIWLALVFVMILHWLKKAAILNFLEDHAPKLEQFVFTWQTFKVLQHPWQSWSKNICIWGFQKGKTWTCTSMGIRFVVYQSLADMICYIKIEFSVTSNFDTCNSDAPWGTWSCFTFLETSNQYLLGLRLSWVLQHFKCLPDHYNKS